LSHPVRTVKIHVTVGWECAAGTTAPRNRVRKRATQPAKILHETQTKSFNTEHTEKSGEIRLVFMSATLASVISVEFLGVLCVSDFFPELRFFQIRGLENPSLLFLPFVHLDIGQGRALMF
jgi:hypothetical protein